ncbi:manganese efflux pump [Mesorhizobium sp. KR1-2]|uniref:manganese efflux pump n=1 Tax=Mesorhizobium sp. KR1-2 TaxID=3156609 RepID=UPI0032B5E586
MDWFFIAALAFASSIDNLAAGLSYGVRGIRIGLGANLIIAAICFAFSEVGILFGQWIGEVLPGNLPDIVGAVLLFLIGIRILLLVLPRAKEEEPAAPTSSRGTLAGWFARVLAVESGRIGLVEALLLGVALSANALANAVGAGLLHMPSLAIALSASIGSLVTISLGVALGLRATQISIGRFDLGRFGTLVSGVILVCLAIGQIW